MYRILANNGTAQTPTLTVLDNVSRLEELRQRDDARLKYIPPWMRLEWQRGDFRFGPRTLAQQAQQKRLFKKYLEIVAGMHHSGVQILAGTDTSNPYCLPGFSLHDELSLLVAAGLTPADALRSATFLPAQYVGPSIAIGAIATGRRADAVLLNANPLTDIHNTTHIEAVVCRGRYFDRAALDRMLRDVELYARRSAVGPPEARRP